MKYDGFYNRNKSLIFNPLRSFWKISTVLNVLESLSHIKDICFINENPNYKEETTLEIDLGDHDETIDDTEQIFKSAFEIIQNKFSEETGSFKIVDNKYGFIIFKERTKPPKMYNQDEVNGRPVTDILIDKEKDTVSLRLRPKRRRKCKSLQSSGEEIIMSKKII